jgi:hypothetical protein
MSGFITPAMYSSAQNLTIRKATTRNGTARASTRRKRKKSASAGKKKRAAASSKPKRLVKGSAAAKAYMAKIRKKRKSK